MDLKSAIESKKIEFEELCKMHDVKSLYAFGSATNDTFNEETSDIDLLIEIETIDPVERGEKLISVWDKFESFFKRRVDLLTYSSIKNPFLKKSIDSSKILIYDRQGHKVSF